MTSAHSGTMQPWSGHN